jgi:hypothetical protein
MRQMKSYILRGIFVCITILVPGVVCAVDIGSDTTVDRFSSQVNLLDGDRIAGFAAIEAGFQLLGVNVSAIFDSFFEVTGDIALNGGELTLYRDLIMRNRSSIGTLGRINGNGHTLEFSSMTMCVPRVAGDSANCFMTFVTDAPQFSDVETLDWTVDDRFIAIGTDPTGDAGELRIYEFDGSTLTFRSEDDTLSGKTVPVVRSHPSPKIVIGVFSFMCWVNFATAAAYAPLGFWRSPHTLK